MCCCNGVVHVCLPGEQDRLDTVRSSSRESNRSSHSVDGRYHQAIEKDPENPGADTDVDKLIAWFDVVKKVSRVKQRTMLVVPSVERPVVAGIAVIVFRVSGTHSVGSDLSAPFVPGVFQRC